MKRTLRNTIYSAWDVFLIILDQKFSTARSKLSLSFQGCPYGEQFKSTGKCHFKARRGGSIKIGNSATLLSGWRSNRAGLNGPVLLTTLDRGVIEIGERFGASAIIISSRTGVRIGDRVMLGTNVRIFDHDFHSMDPAIRGGLADSENCKSSPVRLGDDVFVGANALILKGVELGDRVIVGAGAVVTRSFPPDATVVGNPAREIIRKRSSGGTSETMDHSLKDETQANQLTG